MITVVVTNILVIRKVDVPSAGNYNFLILCFSLVVSVFLYVSDSTCTFCAVYVKLDSHST